MTTGAYYFLYFFLSLSKMPTLSSSDWDWAACDGYGSDMYGMYIL